MPTMSALFPLPPPTPLWPKLFTFCYRDWLLGEKRREFWPPPTDTSKRKSLLLFSAIRLFFSFRRCCKLSNRYCFSNLCACTSYSTLFYFSSYSRLSLISWSSLASTALLSRRRFSFCKLRTRLLAFSYFTQHISPFGQLEDYVNNKQKIKVLPLPIHAYLVWD